MFISNIWHTCTSMYMCAKLQTYKQKNFKNTSASVYIIIATRYLLKFWYYNKQWNDSGIKSLSERFIHQLHIRPLFGDFMFSSVIMFSFFIYFSYPHYCNYTYYLSKFDFKYYTHTWIYSWTCLYILYNYALFLNLCFSTGNFQDEMLVGRSLASLILHISAEHKAFKIKI